MSVCRSGGRGVYGHCDEEQRSSHDEHEPMMPPIYVRLHQKPPSWPSVALAPPTASRDVASFGPYNASE
jgi:hypothetical protein